MNVFLFLVGAIGIIVSIILLIKNLVKKESKKKSAYVLGICFTVMVIGFAITEVEEPEQVIEEKPLTEEVVVEEDEETDIDEMGELEEIEEEPEPVEFNPDDYNKELTYEDLARNPEEHIDKSVTFEGKIIQVIQGEGFSQYRIATNDDYDKVMLIGIDNSQLESRILEDDYIRFYGTHLGEITYESTLGGNITVPGVSVDKFEFQ